MAFSKNFSVVVAMVMASVACGRSELSSINSSETGAQTAPATEVALPPNPPDAVIDQRVTVPAFFDRIKGREICSGKVTEEWTNEENGQKIRQVWQRRASFVYMAPSGDNFSVGYKVVVDSDFFVQAQDGTWQPEKKSSYDSFLQFNSAWNQTLNRYVGQTRWLASHKDGVAVDLSGHSDQKITAMYAQGDKVVLKYVDIFPRAARDNVAAHLSAYEETLGLVGGKLERSWSYQDWAFNPETLEPTTKLNLGAQPSFDTEAKCAE